MTHKSADVTIRGAGVFGLSIAWACAVRGARVRVIDPGGIGAGASGGIVGALSPHTPERWNPKKAFQLESLLMAADWWALVTATGGGDPGYGRIGRLQPVAHTKALELAHIRGVEAGTLWQGKASWQVIAASDAPDWAPPSPTGWLIHDTLSARIHPRHALAALARALRAKGADITQDGPDAGSVLWATGAHDLAFMQVEGAAVKGQAALLSYDAPGKPQLFVDGLHIIPHADGTIAIGSTSERNWAEATSTDAQLDGLIARARAALPALTDAPIIERWAGLRPRSATRAPILGAHPVRKGAFIANGGFKIGFGMAPLIAEVMTDLLLEGRDGIPEDFRA